ncbi:MAG: glycyl-radical enzyme activating protein [Lewinellaceae bacterium]|nr:glycyl-radical enzyme activating protein [Lewinellaceae bacterium]
MRTGLIFDIQRYAIHDGPGIRMTIFFKGCPLSCAWCHNPESQSPRVQKMYSANKCIGSQDCVRACPNEALTLTPHGIVTDMEACQLCGECVRVCPTKAMEFSGHEETLEGLMQQIEREIVFFDQSGGGVTFSGGEPLMHYQFLIPLLKACGEKGIHRAVDTSGFTKTKVLLEVARHTDLFLFDLKLMDPVRHKAWTGVRNEKILHNLKVLAETGVPIQIRIPLIKGVNCDEENIRETAGFIAGLPGEKRVVSLLPYHDLAIKKHERLGQTYRFGQLERPSENELRQIEKVFEENGIRAVLRA